MNNPFKKGDKVHHIFYGEGEVVDPDAQNHVKENGRTVLARFLCGEIRQYAPKELSFTPWAQPDHTRPLEDGVYLIYNKSIDVVIVRGFYEGVWYFMDQNLKTTTSGGRKLDTSHTIIKKVS